MAEAESDNNEIEEIEAEEFNRSTYAEFESKDFTKRVFYAVDALAYYEEIDGEKYRTWGPYDGKPFDEDACKIVPGGWDHEHCVICGLTIHPGDEYLENKHEDILCFACEEEYRIKAKAGASDGG